MDIRDVKQNKNAENGNAARKSTPDIRDVAAKYLASRMRTCAEMRSYLFKKDFDDVEINQVIGEFVDFHYLDDEEYCRQYINYASEKGKGASRIRAELAEKGVDRDVISFALEDYYDKDVELERALHQAQKTMAGKPMDEKMKGRIGRRLFSLGYSTDVVYKVIGMCMRDEE